VNDLLAWFNARAPRERTAMAAGAVALLLLAGYGWIWLPLASDTTKMRNGIAELRAQAVQVAAGSLEAKRLAAAPKPQTSGDPLATAVEQNVLAGGMKDRMRTQPLDAGRVQVSAEGVGFNEWINMLATLQQARNARVESARIEPQPGSNLVRVQAVLARPVR